MRHTDRSSRLRAVLTAVVLLLPFSAAAAPPSAGDGTAGHGNAVAAPANPADGVLNEGDRTLAFDKGWKFKLVNTADTVDPSGLYGDSANPLAAAASFDDASWDR
jgi:hypothetical protein